MPSLAQTSKYFPRTWASGRCPKEVNTPMDELMLAPVGSRPKAVPSSS